MKIQATALLSIIAIVLASCASSPDSSAFKGESTRSVQVKKEDLQQIKVSPINNPEPQGSVELIDDFESDFMLWYPESSNRREDRSIKAGQTDDWASSNERSLSLSFAPLKEGFTAGFSYPIDRTTGNWQGAELIAADFYNPTDRPFSLSIEVQSGDSHSITKTQDITIGCGDNLNVYFDLVHDLCDENGNSQPGIPEDDDVRQMTIRIREIAEKKKGGTILVDNIRLVK